MSAALYLLTICVRRSLAPLPPHAVVRASGRKRRILEDEYEVDRILERVVKKYSVEYLIAWVGYGPDAATPSSPRSTCRSASSRRST